MKTKTWGSLTITENGKVVNHEKGHELKIHKDTGGNPSFTNPDLKKNIRLDYAIAMLFLNDGKFCENIAEYYIEHKDGDITNCKLENLILYTDRNDVFNKRFSYLRKDKDSFKEAPPVFVYVGDSYNLTINEYSIRDATKKFGLSRETILSKAKEGTYLLPNTVRYVIADNYLDAWDLL